VARFPCVFFPAVSRPGTLHAELIAKYGTLPWPYAPPADLRTRRQLQELMEAFRACDNDGFSLSLSPWQHLTIVKCPLMAVYPAEILVIPLHTTLGGTLTLIDFGLEAVFEAKGAAASIKAAESLGQTLLEDIRVSPVPYNGGVMKGRECHRTRAKYPLVCDTLAPYLAVDKLATLRAERAD